MINRLLRHASADAETATGLEDWEAEGGASARTAQARENGAATLSAAEHLLLERLGAALVGEWNNLPMPLQRAIYDRAVSGGLPCSGLTLKQQMARFLHDHKGHPDSA